MLSWPRDTRVRNRVSLYTELRLRLSRARGEAGDRGWVAVKTGDKRMKIMYYDEKVSSRSVASS